VAGAQAAPAPTVFDRTLVCATGVAGPKIHGAPRGSFGGARGGVAVARTLTGSAPLLIEVGPRSGVFIDKQYCSRSTNRVPLTRKGLPGPPRAFGSVRCPFGRVLVRLRYTYLPGPHPPSSEVGGRLISAAIAVRTYRTLKPLAFVSLTTDATNLQFYSAASCI
jgi:hypothetical protein